MHQPLAQVAAQRGYPATLFGYAPTAAAYWREPALPWAPAHRLPLRDRSGMVLIWHYAEFTTDHMAPRFPAGTVVSMAPVGKCEYLTVGRVYAYRQVNPTTGAETWQAGRLAVVQAEYLLLTQDNAAEGLLWPLRAQEDEATWDVYELTHYVQYPVL